MVSVVGIRRFLASRVGRIGAGFALFSALIVFLWPTKAWTFEVEKLVAVIAALGTWLWSELDGAGEPHPHDAALFEKLVATVRHEERLRLAEHDMGNSFPIRAFDGLGDIADTWKGAAFEFQDRTLNKRWAETQSAIDTFTSKLNRYTGPMPANPGLATVKTHEDMKRGQRSPRTLQNTKELNEAAADVSKLLDGFEKLARAKLKV